jgi:hypothetical protein
MIRPNNALTKESMEKNKLKLNIWNNDIKIAIKQNKLAHKQWKEAGKPKRPEHPLLLHKVETRKI